MQEGKITFIATAFNETNTPLIKSLLAQTNENWRLIIYHNGPNLHLETEIKALNDSRIVYLYTEEDNGFWGCLNRIKALELVDTEYVVQTSIQQYYMPICVDMILHGNEDLIYWDSISHYSGWKLLDSELQIGRIDWGNFAVRTVIAKEVGINWPKEFAADGLFINDLMASNKVKSERKIDMVLTVHN